MLKPDALWKVLGGLTQADLDEINERLKQQQEGQIRGHNLAQPKPDAEHVN